MTNKTYSKLIKLATLKERFNYLKITDQFVGQETFGSERYLNQLFYKLPEWKKTRREVILRDSGNELALDGYPIRGHITVHHIVPITVDDIINRSPILFDPNNLVCTGDRMHKAIHYGDESLIYQDPVTRKPNDTCPWKE